MQRGKTPELSLGRPITEGGEDRCERAAAVTGNAFLPGIREYFRLWRKCPESPTICLQSSCKCPTIKW